MTPPRSGNSLPWKQIAWVGLITLVGYIAVFQWIEFNRRKDGPWQLTFTTSEASPTLVINHPKLGIADVTIQFVDAPISTNLPQTLQFTHGQVAPLELPFGKCVFLDTLFLPGSAACEIYGHEIQFMPRILTIDQVEHPWRSGEKILLTNPPSATLPPP